MGVYSPALSVVSQLRLLKLRFAFGELAKKRLGAKMQTTANK